MGETRVDQFAQFLNISSEEVRGKPRNFWQNRVFAAQYKKKLHVPFIFAL